MGAYTLGVAPRTETAATPQEGGGESAPKASRRPPSPEAHAKRVAWGRKFGPLAARAIKDAIKRAEVA